MARASLFVVCSLSVCVALAGCSGRQQLATLDGQGMAPEGADEKNVAIEVVSRMFMDCNVYLQVGSAGRRRLGTATGMSTTTLGVHWSADLANSTHATLIAEPVGSSRNLVSTPFMLSESGRVVWTIQGHQNAAPTEVSLQVF